MTNREPPLSGTVPPTEAPWIPKSRRLPSFAAAANATLTRAVNVIAYLPIHSPGLKAGSGSAGTYILSN